MTKEELEKVHAQGMNDEAIARIKAEAVTAKSEDVWFPTGKKITLLDGKEYMMKPSKLGQGRRLMKLLGNISLDSLIINFIETGNEEADKQRVDNFYEALQIALYSYPEITREYLDEYCDFSHVREILDYIIEANNLKK
jgi:hypothetical protein